jgi:hypothetical protein
MLRLQGRHVEVVGAFEPELAHCLEPRGRKHLDVLPALGDIAVFGAVGAAHDEVRYVGGEVELDGCAEVCANVAEGRLRWSEICIYK